MRLRVAFQPRNQIPLQTATQGFSLKSKILQGYGAHSRRRGSKQTHIFQESTRIRHVAPAQHTQTIKRIQQGKLGHRTITTTQINKDPKAQQSKHDRLDTGLIRLDLLVLQQFKYMQDLQHAQTGDGIIQQDKQTLQRLQLFARRNQKISGLWIGDKLFKRRLGVFPGHLQRRLQPQQSQGLSSNFIPHDLRSRPELNRTQRIVIHSSRLHSWMYP